MPPSPRRIYPEAGRTGYARVDDMLDVSDGVTDVSDGVKDMSDGGKAVADSVKVMLEGTCDVVPGTEDGAVDAELNSSFIAPGISGATRPMLQLIASTMQGAMNNPPMIRARVRNVSMTCGNR